MSLRHFVVYILTNDNESVLYIGVTNDLARRLHEHREKIVPGFTKDYGLFKLVHFEISDNPEAAIGREKQLKRWSRVKKEQLIERMNPGWNDLTDVVFGVD